jgi:hypothetical protein
MIFCIIIMMKTFHELNICFICFLKILMIDLSYLFMSIIVFLILLFITVIINFHGLFLTLIESFDKIEIFI